MFFKGLLAGFCVAEFLWSFALHQFYFMGTDGYWWVSVFCWCKEKKNKKADNKKWNRIPMHFFFCFHSVLLLEIYTNRFVFEFCNHQTPKPFALFFFCYSDWWINAWVSGFFVFSSRLLNECKGGGPLKKHSTYYFQKMVKIWFCCGWNRRALNWEKLNAFLFLVCLFFSRELAMHVE